MVLDKWNLDAAAFLISFMCSIPASAGIFRQTMVRVMSWPRLADLRMRS